MGEEDQLAQMQCLRPPKKSAQLAHHPWHWILPVQKKSSPHPLSQEPNPLPLLISLADFFNFKDSNRDPPHHPLIQPCLLMHQKSREWTCLPTASSNLLNGPSVAPYGARYEELPPVLQPMPMGTPASALHYLPPLQRTYCHHLSSAPYLLKPR